MLGCSRINVGTGGIRTRYQADGYDGIRNERTKSQFEWYRGDSKSASQIHNSCVFEAFFVLSKPEAARQILIFE